MKEKIDWEALALQLGTLSEGGESGGGGYTPQALEILVGEENLREAVDHYISGGPGSELARSVLWQIQPWSAMKYCYDIYKSEKSIEERRMAVELLRVVADSRGMSWIDEFLEDEDSFIQAWGFEMLDQLMMAGSVDEEDAKALLQKAEQHANVHVRERAAFIRENIEREAVVAKLIRDRFDPQTGS